MVVLLLRVWTGMIAAPRCVNPATEDTICSVVAGKYELVILKTAQPTLDPPIPAAARLLFGSRCSGRDMRVHWSCVGRALAETRDATRRSSEDPRRSAECADVPRTRAMASLSMSMSVSTSSFPSPCFFFFFFARTCVADVVAVPPQALPLTSTSPSALPARLLRPRGARTSLASNGPGSSTSSQTLWSATHRNSQSSSPSTTESPSESPGASPLLQRLQATLTSSLARRDFDIGDSVACLRYYAGFADKIVGQVC